jgi:hypothetical protein
MRNLLLGMKIRLRELLEIINGKMVKIRYILPSTNVYIRRKQGSKTQRGVGRE